MPQPLDSKGKSLRQQGVLNPNPEKVADPLFHDSEFFDPRDLVQVKYEMLRRVRVDRASVSEVTQKFGFSRPVFYQTQAPSSLCRPAGPDPSTNWTSSGPQALRPRGRFPAPTSASRPVAPTHRALGVGSRALQHRGPSPQH